MDNETVGLVFRGVERIIVASAGLMAVYLGFRSLALNVLGAQSAEFTGAGLSVKLAKVAPGALFALFGAVILCYLVLNPFKHETPEGGLTAYLTSGGVPKREVIRAANTAIMILRAADTKERDTEAAVKTVETLEMLRNAMLAEIYGPQAVLNYRRLNGSSNKLEIDALTQNEKDQFKQVDATVTGTFFP